MAGLGGLTSPAINNDLSPSLEAVDMELSSGGHHPPLRVQEAWSRDVSDLFPAVVKNVASKNIEVKKLV